MGNSVTRFAKIAAFIVMSIAATESHGLAQSKSGRIDKLITLYHKYGQFNGVILVAQRGQVVYEHAFGQSNFELNSPNTVDTKFEIACITKPMTALLIMQLVSDGYAVLGAIIEHVTGKSYWQVLAERILEPAGMTKTVPALLTPLILERASGYRMSFSGTENAPHIGATPAGGLYSTLGDLYR